MVDNRSMWFRLPYERRPEFDALAGVLLPPIPIAERTAGDKISVSQLIENLQENLDDPNFFNSADAKRTVVEIALLVSLLNRSENTSVSEQFSTGIDGKSGLLGDIKKPAAKLNQYIKSPPDYLNSEEELKFADLTDFVSDTFLSLAEKFSTNASIQKLAFDVAISAVRTGIEIVKRAEREEERKPVRLANLGDLPDANPGIARTVQDIRHGGNVFSTLIPGTLPSTAELDSSFAAKLETVTAAVNRQTESVVSGIISAVKALRNTALSASNSAGVERAILLIESLSAAAVSLPGGEEFQVRVLAETEIAVIRGTGFDFTAAKTESEREFRTTLSA